MALGLPATLSSQAHAQGGVPLWTNFYNGTANGSDAPWSVAVDSHANVFVTGFSYQGSNYDVTTIKYTSAGVPAWTNRHGGQAATDIGLAVRVDPSDNVFVTGGASGDYATIAYSNSGSPLWTNRYNGPGADYDRGDRIAVGLNGKIYVTGHSWGNGSAHDYATISYSSGGTPLWTNRYNGPGNGWDEPYGIAVDGTGNVFVIGYSQGTNSQKTYATIAYTSAGVPLWTNRYGVATNKNAEAHAVAVNNNGKIFVTGYAHSHTGLANDQDYVTVAYAHTGEALWTNRYAGTANGPDFALGAVADAQSVYVTGSSRGSGGFAEYTTIKYSEVGTPLWTNRYAPMVSSPSVSAITLDSNGNVFVAGTAATLAYTSSGLPLWTNVHDVSAKGICVDTEGNVFLTGLINSLGSTDFATIKYSSSLRPSVFLQNLDDQAVLSWSNASFSLQTALTIDGVFTNIPGAISPHTNSPMAPQQYFRLSYP